MNKDSVFVVGFYASLAVIMVAFLLLGGGNLFPDIDPQIFLSLLLILNIAVWALVAWGYGWRQRRQSA